jgi:hypothetical protein
MEKKDKTNFIKDLRKSPKGNAILFFVGYFFFFVFLCIFVRVGGNGTTNRVNNLDKKDNFDFSVTNIINNNYSFSHSIDIDGVVVSYVGKRFNDNDLFTVTKSDGSFEYYRDYIEYFVNTSGVWISGEDPYLQSRFFDIEELAKVLGKSSLIYKTDYESGKKVYNYAVTTTSIYELFEGDILDIADDANEITVKVDSDNQVYEINLNLDSYCKSLNYCSGKMRVNLSYNDFGKVEKITSPLD